jgi:gluconolactonase
VDGRRRLIALSGPTQRPHDALDRRARRVGVPRTIALRERTNARSAGRLIACSHRGRCLYRTEYDGHVTTIVDRHAGKRLNSPNDVVVKSDGSIWFTDPLYGIANDYEGGRQASEQPPAVHRLEPESGDIRIVADDFDGPNGLARLYIAETGNQNEQSPRQYIRVFNAET